MTGKSAFAGGYTAYINFYLVVDYKNRGMKLLVRVGDEWGHQREGARKVLKGYRPQRRVIQVSFSCFNNNTGDINFLSAQI